MRTHALLLTLLGTSLAYAAAPLPAPATARGGPPVIMHMVSRDQTLTIRSGPAGLLYSLVRADGTVLLADASTEQLANLHPAVYRQLRNTVAGSDAPGSEQAWAGCE